MMKRARNPEVYGGLCIIEFRNDRRLLYLLRSNRVNR
jgi:hypothetical protein